MNEAQGETYRQTDGKGLNNADMKVTCDLYTSQY